MLAKTASLDFLIYDRSCEYLKQSHTWAHGLERERPELSFAGASAPYIHGNRHRRDATGNSVRQNFKIIPVTHNVLQVILLI